MHQYVTVIIADSTNIEWMSGRRCGFYLDNCTHVWRINITKAKSTKELWPLLDVTEQERANRFHRPVDKQRFVVSRVYLRYLLNKYIGIDAGAIEFAAGQNNKPFVKNTGVNIAFNVSHSGGIVLLAFSHEEVGVDVEQINTAMKYTDVMDLSYSGKEVAFVEASKNPTESFYKFWTRKEALLKATAKGITDDMKLVPCMDGEYTLAAGIIGSEKNWNINSFVLDNSHAGCVAYSNSSVYFWTADDDYLSK